ncbi:hypothetical protein JJB98_28945 [Bradyrhizobium diazoefficiens]|nr:hypothetical protein [Bradyrhizobium diazoefficiens]QQO23659.1 hypothetical protein JJB98_28945 [Bradyrhizobium diazoefficiens]
MPMALVVASRPYLTELKQAIDQPRMQVITSEFDSAVSLAVEHQPDLILVAPPPIPDVLHLCERLLENGLTKNIPIFLISVDHSAIDGGPSLLHMTASQARDGDLSDLQKSRRWGGTMGQDERQYVPRTQRQKQLLSILDLLHYVEGEIAEIGIETSAALLEATIADVAQWLRRPEPDQSDRSYLMNSRTDIDL